MAKKLNKELREWIVLVAVVGVLILTGWYKDVASLLQRGLLETGLVSATTEDGARPAEYDFTLVDFDGNSVPFQTFQGKVVFMNFWATWCPPCIAEMPDIHDLYEKVGEDVQFVMISVDSDQAKAREFIQKKGFDFPVYFLSSSLPQTYETSTIPTTYILSPQGEIVLEESGLTKYDTQKIRDFLKDLGKRQQSP